MEINMGGGIGRSPKQNIDTGQKNYPAVKNLIAKTPSGIEKEKQNSDIELSRTKNISKGESEIKALLNSGFIIKNDENFLLNVYGFIDKNVRSNFNGLFLKNNFVEVQGASFGGMTPYGRNITVKNIIMSSAKFNEINSAKYAGNYARCDERFNGEYNLSKFTLNNYFGLKKTVCGIDAKNSAPGVIDMAYGAFSKHIKYTVNETPSSYKFKLENNGRGTLSVKRPELGILKDYKDTADGFKNIKVKVNDKKILEMESIHNWQKITSYVKTRDLQFLNGLKRNEKGELLNRIEVHHINQLQDDGKENVNNLIAIGEETHRLADSYKILIDKNTGYYREHYSENIAGRQNINCDNACINGNGMGESGKIPYMEKNYNKLLTNISGLNLNDKITLNDIKLDVEANSAMRLNMLNDTGEYLRLLFIDAKTGEELRLLAAKTNDETDRNIAKTALINFIKDLATSTIS